MITASNPYSSSDGPSEGATVVLMPCSAPATATSTNAIPVASA